MAKVIKPEQAVSDNTKDPLPGTIAYWKQVAHDAITANETARNDIETLKRECETLKNTVDRLKFESGSVKTHAEYETPPIKELIRGVRCGCYDMTVSISLFRGDNNGTKYGCGYEDED